MNWKPPADGKLPDGWEATNVKDGTFLGTSPKVWLAAGAIILVIVAGVIGASSGGNDDTSSSPRRDAYRSTVDALSDDGDCASLQARFNDWADGNEANPAGSERARDFLWGMEYADDAMRRIGCYD